MGEYNSFAEDMGKAIGTYSKCVEVGLIGVLASLFIDFETQGKMACKAIAKDHHFDNGFTIVGLSQGGLLARYVVENCPGEGGVDKLFTFGGPHYGVADFPGCSIKMDNGWMCRFINKIVKTFVYWALPQHFIGPAGYFRDPQNLLQYEKYSHFLPSLNNERGTEFEKLIRRKRI